MTAVALHVHSLLESTGTGMPTIDWGDTVIELPGDAPREWHSALSRDSIRGQTFNDAAVIRADSVLTPLPVALLISAARPEI